MNFRLLVPAVVCLGASAIATTCRAQGTPDSTRRFIPFVSAGTSEVARLPDGAGVHAEIGLIHPLGRGLRVRIEAARHAYGAVPLATCTIQDATHCYQVMDRHVTAGTVNAVYGRPFRRVDVYLIAGAGLYYSRRVATRYPSCDVAGPCDNATYQLEIRATQPGVNGGIGAVLPLGKIALFTDARLHFISRTSPSGGPSNDYFLMPFTVGLRL